MACPFLDYRDSDGDLEFDSTRPYCTVADRFVSPMQADICNDRHDFNHQHDCDVYQQYATMPESGAVGRPVGSDLTQ